jgi:hypothetical protein
MSSQANRKAAYQLGLFRAPMPRLELADPIRAALLPLIQHLLLEVVQRADNTTASETGHDEDNT